MENANNKRVEGTMPCKWPDILRKMEVGVDYFYPNCYRLVNAITTAQTRLRKNDGFGFKNRYDTDGSFIVLRTK